MSSVAESLQLEISAMNVYRYDSYYCSNKAVSIILNFFSGLVRR